jgi:hypothetical protein
LLKLILFIVTMALALPADAAQPESWTVRCNAAGGVWHNTTAPNITNGAFQFTLPDGTEVRTTAGMNCWAVKNAAKVG